MLRDFSIDLPIATAVLNQRIISSTMVESPLEKLLKENYETIFQSRIINNLKTC